MVTLAIIRLAQSEEDFVTLCCHVSISLFMYLVDGSLVKAGSENLLGEKWEFWQNGI